MQHQEVQLGRHPHPLHSWMSGKKCKLIVKGIVVGTFRNMIMTSLLRLTMILRRATSRLHSLLYRELDCRHENLEVDPSSQAKGTTWWT